MARGPSKSPRQLNSNSTKPSSNDRSDHGELLTETEICARLYALLCRAVVVPKMLASASAAAEEAQGEGPVVRYLVLLHFGFGGKKDLNMQGFLDEDLLLLKDQVTRVLTGIKGLRLQALLSLIRQDFTATDRCLDLLVSQSKPVTRPHPIASSSLGETCLASLERRERGVMSVVGSNLQIYRGLQAMAEERWLEAAAVIGSVLRSLPMFSLLHKLKGDALVSYLCRGSEYPPGLDFVAPQDSVSLLSRVSSAYKAALRKTTAPCVSGVPEGVLDVIRESLNMPTGLRADTHLRAAIILFARHDAGEALYNLRCANEVRTGDIFTLSLLISLGFSLKRPDLVRKYAADMKAAAVDMKQDRIAHLYITPLQKSLNGAFSSSECQRSIRTLRLAEAAAYDDLWEDTSELLQQTDVQHLRGPFDIYCCHRLVAFAAHVHKERRSVELQVQLAEDSFPSGFRVDVPLRLLQANVLAKRGQEPEAKEVLQQLWSLTKSPDEFSMRVAILSQPSTFKPSELLSSVLRALLSVENDPVKKGPLLEEALRVSPSDSLTHEHIDLLISQGQASRAMSELQRLVKANPGDQRAHVQLARLYQNEERYEEALKHYKAASSPEKVLKHIALCCYKTGLISEAIENYRGALVSQPQSSHILYQLGVLYEKEEGQPNEARGFYQQIAKDTDSRYSYYSRLALANIAMNALDFALACFHCDEALEHLCADEQVRVVKAEALLSQYDAAGAFAQLDGMRPVEPTSIWAADYMGLPCEASRLAAELSETCALNVIAKAWIRLREAGKEDVHEVLSMLQRSDDMEGTALGVTVFQCYGRLILNSRLLEVADTLATALQRIEHVKRVDPSPLRGLPPWLHASTLLYVSLSQFMLFKTDVETQLTVKRFLDLGRKCGGVFGNERGYLDQFVPDEFLKELFDSDKTTTAAEQFSRIRYMGLLPANHSSFIHFRLFLDKSPLVFTQTLWTDVGAAVVSRQAHTCDVMAAVHSVSSQLPLNAGHYRVLVQLLLSCLGTHHRANLTSKLPKLPKPRIHVTKTPHPNCFIPPSRPFVPPPLRGRPMVVEPDTVLPKKTAITAPTNHPTLLPLDRKATDPNPVTIRRLPRKLVLEVPRDLPAECFIQRSALVLGEALGKGSFGKVMSGSYHGRPVAVKQVFIDAKQLSSRLWNDIVKEVESLSKLHHPSLVEFVGASFDPGEFLIVTELCARGSLSMLLHGKDHVKPTPLNWIERLSLALQISKGVHFLHNRKVIHRDLKPQNIVLSDSLEAKICDFGMTHFIEPDKTHLTIKPGMGAGSPRYMAPELYNKDRHITEAVDVWALGCILVEVFGGRPPFPDCTSMEHIAYVLLVKKEIPKIPDKFPSGLKSLLKKCLVLDPEKRVGMDAVICDLQRVDIR